MIISYPYSKKWLTARSALALGSGRFAFSGIALVER